MYGTHNLLKRASILKNAYLKNKPFMMLHRITKSCNCRCQACDWWKHPVDRDKELSLPTLKKIFQDAVSVGLSDYIIYGGEPLLREDLDSIVVEAKKAGLFVVITTNGVLLEDRAPELAPYTDLCVLSVDAVGEDHDQLRNYPGVFDKAMKGIAAMKRENPRVAFRFWSQIHHKNLDKLEDIVKLGAELGIKAEFFPIWLNEGHNESLLLADEEMFEGISKIEELKKRGYPVFNTCSAINIMKNRKPFVCNLPKYSVNIDFDGKIIPCGVLIYDRQEWFEPLGQSSIADLVNDSRYKEMVKRYESCNHCYICGAMETKDDLFLSKLEFFTEALLYSFRNKFRSIYH